MPQDLSSPEVADAIRAAREAAGSNATRAVRVSGGDRTVPYPYPSPGDWREHWIYFLMLDRFNNPDDAAGGNLEPAL